MNPDIENCLIKKQILHAGNVFKPLRDGCKVYFHFQTRKAGSENDIIDDSKVIGKKEPMILVLGKKFKLEVWEVIVKKMAEGEVAKFTCDKSLVMQYPFVSKTIRDITKEGEHKRSHICAHTLNTEGVGYDDLNDFLKKPYDLDFIIELIKVEYPEDYEKEHWQLSDEEKLARIPMLKEKGNEFFSKKEYGEAAKLYFDAVCFCEQLMNKEKPHDEDWNELNQLKLPILLNFAQCKLLEGDYYAVIEHCTTVLQSDPDNSKALYRRAKAHVGAWNPSSAIEDFKKLKEIDSSLAKTVDKELQAIKGLQRERDAQDTEKLKNMFSS